MLSLRAIVYGILNVTQDTVGGILPGGIRREVIIWLRSIMAILLLICHNVQHVTPTSPIALMCMSDEIILSSIIGNRDFSGVWAVRPMSYANAIICPSSLPILGVGPNKHASVAAGSNHLYVAALCVLLVYAKDVMTHYQSMMLIQLFSPIM